MTTRSLVNAPKFFPFWGDIFLYIDRGVLHTGVPTHSYPLSGTEGEQSMPSPNMPFWHFDYFELKLLKKENPAGIRRTRWPSFVPLEA